MEEHRRYSPQCPLVLEQVSATAGTPGGPTNPMEVNGALPTAQDMREESQRRLTFRGWPLSSPSPEDLARAGFFFLGRQDEVECAFCGTQVYDWQPDDEPSHRRWHPHCLLHGEQDNATAGTPEEGGHSGPTAATPPLAPPAEDINEETQRRLSREQNTTAGTPGDGEPSAPTAAIPHSTPPAEDINEETQRRLSREQNTTAGTPGDGEPSALTAAIPPSTPPAEDINEETQRCLSREQNTTAGTPGDGEPSAPTAAIPPSTPPAEDIREESQRRLVRESDR